MILLATYVRCKTTHHYKRCFPKIKTYNSPGPFEIKVRATCELAPKSFPSQARKRTNFDLLEDLGYSNCPDVEGSQRLLVRAIVPWWLGDNLWYGWLPFPVGMQMP